MDYLENIAHKELKNYNVNRYLILYTALILIGVLYYALLIPLWTFQVPTDFYAFYTSTISFFQHERPYQALTVIDSMTNTLIGPNLNPPIIFWLFWPFTQLTYYHALVSWTILSLILSFVSASISFKIAFPSVFLKKYRTILFMVYFLFFSTFINTTTGQIGSFLAFLLLCGYVACQKQQSLIAGILWGILIAIKLFPLLLFFYAFRQRRYKMIAVMLSTAIILSLIPLIHDSHVYSSYYQLISRVPWYGCNWNASIYGFLFRLSFDSLLSTKHQQYFQIFYALVAIFCFGWYLKTLFTMRVTEDRYDLAFCLTIVTMLLLSPFAWVYYFPMLLLPLSRLGAVTIQTRNFKLLLALFLCIALMNFPEDVIRIDWGSLYKNLSINSLSFYGLLLLMIVIKKRISNQL